MNHYSRNSYNFPIHHKNKILYPKLKTSTNFSRLHMHRQIHRKSNYLNDNITMCVHKNNRFSKDYCLIL